MERWLKDLAQLSTYWQAWFLRELNYPSIWESFGRRQRRKAYFRMPCLWIVSYFPVGLCLYLESVTVWHICKLLISWLAFSSCKSKGFSRLRWGMCMTTLCSSRPWHVLHYHGGRGLSEESSLEARALRGRKAGCSCWALEDSDFNLLCSISFLSRSLVFWAGSAGYKGLDCLLPHRSILTLPSTSAFHLSATFQPKSWKIISLL